MDLTAQPLALKKHVTLENTVPREAPLQPHAQLEPIEVQQGLKLKVIAQLAQQETTVQQGPLHKMTA